MNTLLGQWLVRLKAGLINGIRRFVYFGSKEPYQEVYFIMVADQIMPACLSMECIYFLFAKRYVPIKLSEIEFIKGHETGAFMVTQKGTWELPIGLKEIEWMLPEKRFCRIHSFYLVNLEAVVGYDENKIFLQDRQLPLAPDFRRRFDANLDSLLNEDVKEECVPKQHFSYN